MNRRSFLSGLACGITGSLVSAANAWYYLPSSDPTPCSLEPKNTKILDEPKNPPQYDPTLIQFR